MGAFDLRLVDHGQEEPSAPWGEWGVEEGPVEVGVGRKEGEEGDEGD